MNSNKAVQKYEKQSGIFDQDYFENGIKTGKSNYQDYSWDRLGSYFQRAAGHIVKLFNPATALDVGCAKGFLVKALCGIGVDAYGIDPSDYAVSQAPVEIADKVQLDLAQSIAFPDSSFDVVTCFDVLEHIPAQQVPKALKEMLRVSKQWVVLRMVTHEVEGDKDSSHETIRDLEWWTAKVEKAGGVVESLDNYVDKSVWWFNVPEFLMVIRKA